MPEINLLPDDLREKEKKELSLVRKKPKKFRVEMSSPNKQDKVKQPLKESKPSVLSRLFSKKIEKPKIDIDNEEDSAPKLEDIKPERETKKILHIPKPSSSDNAEENFENSKKGFESGDQADYSADRKEEPAISDEEPVEFSDKIDRYIKQEEAKSKPTKQKKSFFSFLKRKKPKSPKPEKLEKIKQQEKPVSDEKKQRPQDREIPIDETLDVNLIPADMAHYPEVEFPKAIKRSIFALAGVLFIIIGAYFGIVLYQYNLSRQISDLETEIASLDSEIASYQDEKEAALDLQKRVSLVRQLLNSHVYWTQFFELLEEYTISDVYYTNFSMAGHDSLVISALGRDYKSVAEQLVAFQQATDFIKTVRINSAAAEVDPEQGRYNGVSFNINLEFLPGIFSKPIE